MKCKHIEIFYRDIDTPTAKTSLSVKCKKCGKIKCIDENGKSIWIDS